MDKSDKFFRGGGEGEISNGVPRYQAVSGYIVNFAPSVLINLDYEMRPAILTTREKITGGTRRF